MRSYVTYFEILYTPVRNVAFFIHLLTGVCLYLMAARLARYGYVTLCAAALMVAVTAIGLFRWLGPAADGHPLILLTGALASYAIMLFSVWRSGATEDVPDWIERPRRQWALALALLVIPLAGATWIPRSAVIGPPWSNRNPTPEHLLASLECPSRGGFCPPPAELIRLAHTHIPADAILAADLNDVYQPSLFMPQQMVMWTGAMAGIPDPETLFSRYYKHLDRARAASLDQPLFNAGETRNDRAAFVRDLGVTHVLVNPRLYATMKAVFDADDLFSPRYDDGQWALYEVNRSSFEAR